jgi:hypothetical protein
MGNHGCRIRAGLWVRRATANAKLTPAWPSTESGCTAPFGTTADEDFGSASKPGGNVSGSTDVFAGERVCVKLSCGREHRPRHDAAALDSDIDTQAITTLKRSMVRC